MGNLRFIMILLASALITVSLFLHVLSVACTIFSLLAHPVLPRMLSCLFWFYIRVCIALVWTCLSCLHTVYYFLYFWEANLYNELHMMDKCGYGQTISWPMIALLSGFTWTLHCIFLSRKNAHFQHLVSALWLAAKSGAVTAKQIEASW